MSFLSLFPGLSVFYILVLRIAQIISKLSNEDMSEIVTSYDQCPGYELSIFALNCSGFVHRYCKYAVYIYLGIVSTQCMYIQVL